MTNDITASDLPVKTGDPSVDYALPSTNNVTVENLDVTEYPQGSMVHVHNLRLPSSAPYLDDPAAGGKSTEGDQETKTGLVTPAGHFHADVKADFEGRDPYEPINYDDVNENGVADAGDTVNVTPLAGGNGASFSYVAPTTVSTE